MNDLEKRTFYSFLGLYLISTSLFILLAGFWYYTSQKLAFENNERYRLEHIADRIGTAIITARMQDRPLQMPDLSHSRVTVGLIGVDGRLKTGTVPADAPTDRPDYLEHNGQMVLVSDAPKDHLGIRYVVVSSDTLFGVLDQLRHIVLAVMAAIAMMAAAVAWTLSKLFLRPLHQRVLQTERFVNDITHELNTPITSLSLTAEQVIENGSCSEKNLRNLSASTRQLYDIYRSLTYLNFAKEEQAPVPIDLARVLEKSTAYYRPLLESKDLHLALQTETLIFAIPDQEAQLLFSNLIGNAVKYSPKGSTVTLSVQDRCITFRDEGIGIAPALQKKIFEPYTRGTEQGGGFGVGLNIVARICTAYGIRLSLDSDEGKGTKIRLCFP